MLAVDFSCSIPGKSKDLFEESKLQTNTICDKH